MSLLACLLKESLYSHYIISLKKLITMQYIKGMIRPVGMISFLLTSLVVNAQEKIKIDKGEIKTWFENYWMWVVGGVIVLILLIALFSRERRISRNGTRKTTTVVKDDLGRTQSVTTTEEPIKLS